MAPRAKKTESSAPAKAAAATKASTKAAATKAAKVTKKTTTEIPSRSRKPAPAKEEEKVEDEETEDDAAQVNGAAEEKAESEQEEEEVKPAPKKKAAASSKAATATAKQAAVKAKSSSKRKDRDDEEPKPTKRTRIATPAVAVPGLKINEQPEVILDIFVFGEGTSGELGLGNQKHENKKPVDVKRPRLNHNLDAKKVGVVAIACGGMHVVALTHNNRILTWGVNDDRALGRDTTWDGGVRDADDSDSDDDDEGFKEMNPNEATPGEVSFTDIVAIGTRFVQVVATDSASFVLTEDGRVYGWGTFRGSDGIIGFSNTVRVQQVPIQVEALKGIKRLAAGANHVLALDQDGKVFTWGSGGQFQLGRKAITRGNKNTGLNPEPCGRFTKKNHAVAISAGSYHSFYIDNHGDVHAWGLNNYSQTGHNDDAGRDDAMVLNPKVVKALQGKKIASIEGGMHHSVVATEEGELLTWGRVDGHQVGHHASVYNEDNTVYDEHEKPRILIEPTVAGRGKAIFGPKMTPEVCILTCSTDFKTTFVAAGTDNNFAITDKGTVYSWGFSANYQTGQGTTQDIEVPTLIDNTAIRERHILWAGAGGQYSIVAAAALEQPEGVTVPGVKTNGVTANGH